MTLSRKLTHIPQSASIAMSQKARDLKARGVDVISLAAGEPDFGTPEHVKAAAKAAIDQEKTKYTAVDGIAELKAAIVRKFSRENGLDYAPDQINVSPGGKAVIYNALAATLNPGDEVIIPAPCWVSYPDMVRLMDGVPRIIDCGEEAGFKLTPDALAGAITPRTRWLILNTPGNPTGAVYSGAELMALGEVLMQHSHVSVLTDEIYEHLIYVERPPSLAAAVPEMKPRVLTMNGVSKAYAMTGWRIGYAGGDAGLIKGMSKIMSQSTTNPSSISQWAAVAALDGDQEFLAERCQIFQNRRDLVCERLGEIPGIRCDRPDGAFYIFADVSDCLNRRSPAGIDLDTDIILAESILQEAHVALVPGTPFHARGYLRFSYAADETSLMNACDRLSDYFSGLR